MRIMTPDRQTKLENRMKAGQEQFVKNLEQALTLDAGPRPLLDRARSASTEELPSWFQALNPGGEERTVVS